MVSVMHEIDVEEVAPTVEDRRRSGRRAGSDTERRSASAPRRASPRIRTLKGAIIQVPGADPIPCLVRNVSTGGARIDLKLPTSASAFELVFDDPKWPNVYCSVVWREGSLIGVQFGQAIDLPIQLSA
jgi:hypothetical protein